jgi:drug/metabolite transporter (DMT)-like permease
MFMLVGLVLLSVAMQLLGAWLLKQAPPVAVSTWWPLALILSAVLALNALRLVVWSTLHRRYPISMAYPLSALLFPCIIVLAWLTGEAIGAWQVLGSLVVMGGVALMLGDPATPPEAGA